MKVEHVLYLFVIIGFLAFFGLNVVSTSLSGSDTNALINSLIDSFGKNLTFVILVGPLSFLCLGLLFWVRFVHKQSITSLTTARTKIDWSRIFFMFGLWGAFLIVTILISFFIYPEDFVIEFNFQKFLPFAILAIILIPLQTSFEEYFFRGYFMQYIGFASKSRAIPLILSSVLFGLMHISNPEVGEMGLYIMIFYIGTGFLLGIMTLMDDGLELALGFHAANNLITALVLTSDHSAFQTHAIFKDISESTSLTSMYLQVFLVYPIILYLCAKKYGWKNWKENLFGKLKEIES
nr:CPBP family intramembrane glutamic endopeptidase [uncultured Flavobacterium sp.]